MRPSRAVVVPALRVLALIGVLLAPWPGLGRAFAAACATVANPVFHLVSVGGVAFDLAPSSALPTGAAGAVLSPWLVVLTLRNVQTGAATRSALNARALVYVPFAILAALALAAPPPRGTRALATALGLLFVGAYVFVGAAAPLALLLADPRVQAVSLGDFGRRVVSAVFVATAEASVAAPVLLWVLARFVADGIRERRRAPLAAERPQT
jgi:hypothetical protein